MEGIAANYRRIQESRAGLKLAPGKNCGSIALTFSAIHRAIASSSAAPLCWRYLAVATKSCFALLLLLCIGSFGWAQSPQIENKNKTQLAQEELASLLIKQLLELQSPSEIIARLKQEEEARANQQADLLNRARITKEQAIQIATKEYPGVVSECVLSGGKEIAFYTIKLLPDGNQKRTIIQVNAVDGQIILAATQDL